MAQGFICNLKINNFHSKTQNSTRTFFEVLWTTLASEAQSIGLRKYSAGQMRRDAYNKSLCKWGHFDKAKTTFEMLLATWFLMCFFKRFRSFVAENLESVGQRAAKLPAIKLWEWFETVQASNPGTLADWGRGRLADFFLRPQLWQLVTLQPFDLQTPNFEHWKI